MENKRVCAIVVTYNRSKYLIELLTNIVKQTVKVDSILVLDNFSNDDTKDKLRKIEYTKSIEENILHYNIWNGTHCYYFRNNQNSGGSGGFSKAFEIARKFDVEYFWVMDDDVSPEKNCLAELLKYTSRDVEICIPNRTTDTFKDRPVIKMNLKNPFLYGCKRKTYLDDYKNRRYIPVVDMPFEGPLISKELVLKIGLPNKDYFIIYDDTDYAYRAISVTNIYFIPSAKLNKKILPVKRKEDLMNWKSYYSYRNSIIFDRKYGKNIFVRYLSPMFLWIELSLKAIYRRKWYNFKVINKSFKDGYLENFGHTINPGEL